MDLLSIREAADALGVSPNRVNQYLRDGALVSGGPGQVPADFILNGAVVKGLPGVITLLRDAQYEDAEILDWLYREDDSLPGSPIQALRENRGTEVKRRAQVAGY